LKGIWDLFKRFEFGQRKHFLNSMPSPDEFRTILEQEQARSDRIGYEFSLLLFHLGNEEYRPAIAERLSEVLRGRVRLCDKVGWWNDAEIGVILTGTSTGGAWKFAHDIRQKVAPSASNLVFRVYTYPTHWSSDDQEYRGKHELEGIERFLVRRMSIWKRVIDVVGAGIGLIFFSLLMLATGVMIKLTSPGPVIFKQERIGLLGKNFTFLKFRSMYVNGNSALHRDYTRKFIKRTVQEDDHIYKMKDDPRITPVGRVLRKTSLDELPQLVNVLKGEMSLVGPRPPIDYEVERYDRWHRRRVLDVKPGITGLWQINGRSQTTFDEMVRLDLKYVREWSLWLDFKILLQTPLAVLSCRGAY
jgi:exopolysaccharide biosynthesis polyprenyl glycosylphosphotransferase